MLNTQKSYIMASAPITSWQIDGETVGEWQTLSFWAPRCLQVVTAAMKLKMLAPWKKSYNQPIQHIRKQDITLPTNIHPLKAMVSPVVMYGWDRWTRKKAERQIIDAFELRCYRRCLRVPWSARRSHQSTLKEISLNIHWRDSCWSWNANILATWCEELTHWKRSWIWERLKVGGEADDRGWDGWMASPSRWTQVWANSGSWW